MSELKLCPFCEGKAELKMVGDNKEFYMYFCSKCNRTPVYFNEARLLEKKAKEVWNRSVDIAERILSQCDIKKMNNCVKKI